jgi:mRNA interferase MazF
MEPSPMESIKQGDVYWVNFDPAIGAEAKKTRPALVVSNDINNEHSPIISIAPITSNVSRVYSFEVELPMGTANLPSRSKIMVNQTRAVDKTRLVQSMGRLSDALMVQVKKALKLHYDL